MHAIPRFDGHGADLALFKVVENGFLYQDRITALDLAKTPAIEFGRAVRQFSCGIGKCI